MGLTVRLVALAAGQHIAHKIILRAVTADPAQVVTLHRLDRTALVVVVEIPGKILVRVAADHGLPFDCFEAFDPRIVLSGGVAEAGELPGSKCQLPGVGDPTVVDIVAGIKKAEALASA